MNYLAITTRKVGEIATDTANIGIQGTSKTFDLAGKGLKELENALDVEFVSKSEVMNDDSNSDIQNPKKSGYCYVGVDRGHRSCVRVGKGDICMSGDIFPTNEICINPQLRQ